MFVFSRIPWFIAGCLFGGALSVWATPAQVDKFLQKLDVLGEVIAQIENHYIDPIDPEALIVAAAKGAVSALDEHSSYFAPKEYAELIEATQGEYAGIGIEVSWESTWPEVTRVFPDSPAERSGLRPGDAILAIGGVDVATLNLDDVLERLRGPVGSQIVLTVRRADRGQTWNYTLRRSWIRVRSVSSMLRDDGILQVRIDSFSRRVAHDLETTLKDFPQRKGLLLDLRGNPGGLFDEAVAVADLFLTGGVIVAAVGRGGTVIEQQDAHPSAIDPGKPVALIVDKRSASASEIVAGALQDRHRARVFGTRTFGKGSVQTILELPDASGLKITVARYITPSGRTIDGTGIVPDEVHGTAQAAMRQAQAWILEEAADR